MNSRSPVAVNNDHLPDPWSQFIDNNTFKESSTSLELESPKEPPQEIAKEAEEKTGILSNHPLSPANDTLLAVSVDFKIIYTKSGTIFIFRIIYYWKNFFQKSLVDQKLMDCVYLLMMWNKSRCLFMNLLKHV